MSEQVTREELKELIDESDGGIVTLTDIVPVPAIGDIPPEDRKVELEVKQVRFGEIIDEEQL